MDEYIKREEAKEELLAWTRCINHPEHLSTDDAMHVLDCLKAADVIEVDLGLREAVALLHKELEKAKQNPVVRDPLAYALYQTWRAVDGARKDGE